jgi:predicted nucleic acid-binding Zn ribbon protein
MKKNNFIPLKFAIKEKAVRTKTQRYLNKALVIKNWEDVASKFVPESFELTKAVDYKNGVLYVACLTKEIAYRIKLLAQRLIEKLNTVLGKNLVFAINIEV